MSMQASDEEAAKVSVAPRVALADIEAQIAEQYSFNMAHAIVQTFGEDAAAVRRNDHPLQVLTMHVMVMKNGFTVVGRSAPASPANFNVELGKMLAYEDCIRQLWPLMGYALCDKLAGI